MISRIETIGVYVSDQDRALNFYVNTLGWEKRLDAPMGPDARWIEVAPPGGQTRIVLYKATPEAPGLESYEAAQTRLGKQTNMGLGTDDIHRTYQELSGRGVQFAHEPKAEAWGIYTLFEDQDGNGYLLVQR